MSHVLAWQRAADPTAVIRPVMRAMRRGGLVVLPTEATYLLAADARCPTAADALARAAEEGPPPALALTGPAELVDWVPNASSLARRLARRCWPGPVTLTFPINEANGLLARLPEATRRALGVDGLNLRVPFHDAPREVLVEYPAPLLVLDTGLSSPQEVAARCEVRLVVDDGPTRFGEPATIVRVDGDRWAVARVGAIDETELAQQTACLIVFICTGNTCRSPMAEALFRKMLADRLGCATEDLPKRGYHVCSAGVAASRGDAAAPEAVAIVKEHGADLTRHASRPATPDLLAQADYLVAMTRSHLMALTDRHPKLPVRPRLLRGDGGDLPDPIGGDETVYRECAATILQHLEPLVAEVAPT